VKKGILAIRIFTGWVTKKTTNETHVNDG